MDIGDVGLIRVLGLDICNIGDLMTLVYFKGRSG